MLTRAIADDQTKELRIIHLNGWTAEDAAILIERSFQDEWERTPERYRTPATFRRFSDPAHDWFVALADNKVVGVAGIVRLDFAVSTWALTTSATDEKWRGKGIGTALYWARMRQITQRETGGCIVEVSTMRPEFFESPDRGFVRVAQNPATGAWLMVKELRP